MEENTKLITVILPNTSTDTTAYLHHHHHHHHNDNDNDNINNHHNHTNFYYYGDDYPPMETPSEMVWATAIQRHYLKVICALGLPGNLAAILTISTMKPRSVATFLVALLAASDSLALVLKLAVNQLYFILPKVTDSFCRCSKVVFICSSYANWVLVLIAAERLVAVVWPMMRNRFLTKMRVYCICALLAVPIVAIHAPIVVNVFAFGMFECRLSGGVKAYSQKAWQVLNYLFYFLLPLGLLFGITIALCVALSRARRCRQRLLGTSVRATQTCRDMQRSERAITTMMLVASFLFMFMVLPHCLYFMFFRLTSVFAHLQFTPRDHLFKQTTILLADSTHAINFYLYFISVRRFRHRVVSLFCCRGRCRCCPWTRPLAERFSFSSRSWSRGAENGGNNNAFQGCCSQGKKTSNSSGGDRNSSTLTSTIMEPTSLEMDCL